MLTDIENSSTFFRVAGNFSRIIKGGVEGIDSKEFMLMMESFEGYDTYKVDSSIYVRFNNSAFLSNYKRNDLLSSKITLYCLEVGEFKKEKFDFMDQMSKMEKMITYVDTKKSLADYYPPKSEQLNQGDEELEPNSPEKLNLVKLYDVVYACISNGEKDE